MGSGAKGDAVRPLYGSGTFDVTDKLAEVSPQVVDDLQRRLDESLAQQVATAEVLKVISRSTFDLQAVLETLIKSAVKLCGANRGSIFLREGEVFPLTASSSSTPEFLQYWAANPARAGRGSATSRVIASGKVEVIADVLADSEVQMPANSLNRIRGTLGVPMLRDNKVEGVMVLTRPEPGPFTQSQIDLVQTFADQAMIAIANTRLFDETQEALERQTATADILKVIASSPSDVQPVFEAIATRANSLVGGFSATVFRFVDGMAHLMAFTPTTPEADKVLTSAFPTPVDNFAPFQMAQDGRVAQIADTETITGEILDIARARGYRSMLFAPLMNKGVSIGLIAVTRLQTGAFSDHHVQLLQTFADQAVIAIENVRLFDEVQAKTHDLTESLQQQTATADVLKVIGRSAFDLDQVFETVVESSVRLCAADRAIVFRFDGEMLRVAKLFNAPGPLKDWLEQNPIRPGRYSVAARAALERRTVHVEDVRADSEHTYGAKLVEPFRTVLGVPMLKGDDLLGVILVYHNVVKPFTDKQILLVSTFAEQAAIAIENVRLFDEVQARTRELAQSLEDLRTAQDRLIQTEKLASLGQLTAGIAHEIKNPLNFVNNFSSLSSELIDELNGALKDVPLDDKTRDDIDELTAMLKANLEKVVQHGKRADSIVKNMLLHSREGSGEQRPADINTIVEESLNLAYHGARAEKAGFNITLGRDLDPAAGAIELYPQEITRVLLNLISNGFYAANKRREAGDNGFEPSLTATTKNLGNRVEIRIRDNGTGIPADVREKIFNPFFTTKPAGEGTGLGLSMSHDIVVKQHGGKIEVDTEPGQFTEFIITLPRTAART
jgi:two-component system, NtrC family, sensor kinase